MSKLICSSAIDGATEWVAKAEAMMTEARRATSDVTFEDKLKLLDRWIKFQTLVARQKEGGMGRGFDTDPDDND